MTPAPRFDKYLDRAVKVIGVLGICASAFIFVYGFFSLPGKVEANTEEIGKIKDWEQNTDKRLTIIEQDVKYLVKGIDKIDRTLSDGRRANQPA